MCSSKIPFTLSAPSAPSTPAPIAQKVELIREQLFERNSSLRNDSSSLDFHMDMNLNTGIYQEFLGKNQKINADDLKYLKDLINSQDVKGLPTYSFFLSNKTSTNTTKIFRYIVRFQKGDNRATVFWETGAPDKLPSFCSVLEGYYDKYKNYIAIFPHDFNPFPKPTTKSKSGSHKDVQKSKNHDNQKKHKKGERHKMKKV
ncbi:hypothetical protein PPL_07820 [Heterostelium album PN500]|uniref:Uncharacterized protein n=1 Tax=Heterostelium pallidum (strain ATCC 26659 / Pp 5 / PN500) TaxID=670386 RepID=D3BH18_HETP5|nr:hypothetical protein PPL_07820 [Heterostelium album PN500]EFA79402.1 hypothetical protein PPL_07820 [Heterostelium album PN500]|eukprot:XP_020431523.1 hypothetical protein PPL_07820 [Heterostelium album PN500]